MKARNLALELEEVISDLKIIRKMLEIAAEHPGVTSFRRLTHCVLWLNLVWEELRDVAHQVEASDVEG